MNINEEVDLLKNELISLRRDLHMYPELGFNEYRSSKKIAEYMRSCGIEVEEGVAKTGVVGLLRGKNQERTIMLRSDMDALPVNEENEIDFKSKNKGIMHACGHDGHMSMLLIASKVLSKHRDKLEGNVKFVFQPNEEDAGAEIMINEGILENPKVDAAFGIHLWSPLNTGEIGIIPGPIMASSYYFKLVIHGKGGHGGAPHKTVDSIGCGSNIMQSSQMIQTKEIDALNPTIITFCKIHAGTSPIIVPEKVEIEGSIRCLHDMSQEVQDRFEQIVSNTCNLYRAEYELEFKCGNILLRNDHKMANLVKQTAIKVVGEEKVIENNISVMLGEDFAEFSKRVPSAFYFVGIANEEKKTNYPHHHPKFNIDEESLLVGSKMHVQSVFDYFAST